MPLEALIVQVKLTADLTIEGLMLPDGDYVAAALPLDVGSTTRFLKGNLSVKDTLSKIAFTAAITNV